MTRTAPKSRPWKLLLAIAAILVLLLAGAILFFGRDREIILDMPISFRDVPQELLVVGETPVL